MSERNGENERNDCKNGSDSKEDNDNVEVHSQDSETQQDISYEEGKYRRNDEYT